MRSNLLQTRQKLKMHKGDFNDQSGIVLPKDSSKIRYKIKQSLSKSKQNESQSLNQSELKHIHAIKPYCSKQRISSRRQSRQNKSPYDVSRSKSRRLENSSRKIEDAKGDRQMGEMYTELISLKSEYKALKNSYGLLIGEKNSLALRQKQQQQQILAEKDRLTNQLQKAKKTIAILQQEIERIKRQCCKVVDLQRFKLKKVEQTLQEKDLMIAYLRNQVDNIKKGSCQLNNPMTFLQNTQPAFAFDFFSKPNSNISALSNIAVQIDNSKPQLRLEEDSLSFSRDKSKEMDSIIHSFLSNHEHSQSHALIDHNFVKKEKILINSLEESPIQHEEDENSQKDLAQPRKSTESQRDEIAKSKETISVRHKKGSKGNMKQKKLQIIIAGDQNVDTINNEETCNDTKRKTMSNSCAISYKQKKKMTAKKFNNKV